MAVDLIGHISASGEVARFVKPRAPAVPDTENVTISKGMLLFSGIAYRN
jgi:hypothetical protein